MINDHKSHFQSNYCLDIKSSNTENRIAQISCDSYLDLPYGEDEKNCGKS